MISVPTLPLMMDSDEHPEEVSKAVRPVVHSWKARGAGQSGKRLSSCLETNDEQPSEKKQRGEEEEEEVISIPEGEAAKQSTASRVKRSQKISGFGRGDSAELLKEFYKNVGKLTHVRGDGDCYLHAPLAALNMCEHAATDGKRLKRVSKKDEIRCKALLTLVQDHCESIGVMITEDDKKRIKAKKVKGNRDFGDYAGDEQLHMAMACALGIPILIVDLPIKLREQTSIDPDAAFGGVFNFIGETPTKLPTLMSLREATNLFTKRRQKRPIVLVHNGLEDRLGHYDAFTNEEQHFEINEKFKAILSNLGYNGGS